MKRLFSLFMLATIATLTFAFTTPKSSAFAETWHFDTFTQTWVQGGGGSCSGSIQACQFVSSLALTAGDVSTVISAIGSSTANRNVAVSGGTTAITAVALRP